ncbi:isopentenyl-diphosphate delta-isomerase [Schaalia georgiae]|nr:isopentenyl-diphosphate delta-isomerase [Schaalia georgiae]
MSLRTGTDRDLLDELSRMDGRPYGAYRSLAGTWDYGDFTIAIDRVQSDPYAPPSVLRAWTTPSGMGLPDEALASSQARLAAADYLARVFYDAAHARAGRDVQIPRPRQEVLQRSYAVVLPDRVEVRFQVRLPARGRTILGRTAARLFDVDVPNIIMDCFDFVTDDEATNTKRRGLLTHIAAYEDYCALRGALDDNGWVAFVADGAVLARRSGVSQLPLADAVPFISPAALRTSVALPHAGTVTGLAIPPGITLIAGGGYHGKSTLLSAIARGVYAHIPGDGRELVATTPNAMKIRAADGRSITDVDISPFIGDLPGGADTTAFSTANASGSTSQAAAISEAVELGSPLLLIDEDTSATNLLIRDARMRSLVAHEPITPLVDRARGLAEGGTSLIMVVGGSGDYLDVADRVLLMDEYLCHDATARARAIVAEQPRPLPGDDGGAPVDGRAAPAPDEGGDGTAGASAVPAPGQDANGTTAQTAQSAPTAAAQAATPAGADTGAVGRSWPADRVPARKPAVDRPKTKALDSGFLIDRQTVDLSDVEQIVDQGQTEAVAWLVRGALEQFAGRAALRDVLARLERQLNSEGLDTITKFGARPGFVARPRMIDVGAAINRYRW